MTNTTKNLSFENFNIDTINNQKLIDYANEVYKDPAKLATADILKLNRENPALASKVLLAAYSQRLIDEAKNLKPEDENDLGDIYESLYASYKTIVDDFIRKNEVSRKTLSLNESAKGGE